MAHPNPIRARQQHTPPARARGGAALPAGPVNPAFMVPTHADNQSLLQLNWLDMTVPRLCMLPASRWVAAPSADRNGCRRRGRSPHHASAIGDNPRRNRSVSSRRSASGLAPDSGVHRAFMVPSPSVSQSPSQWAQVQSLASVPEDRWGSKLRHVTPPGVAELPSPLVAELPLTTVKDLLAIEEPDSGLRSGRCLPSSRRAR